MLLKSGFERALYPFELLMICIAANSFLTLKFDLVYIIFVLLLLLAALALPLYSENKFGRKRLHLCCYGVRVCNLFWQSALVSVAVHVYFAFSVAKISIWSFVFSLLLSTAVEAIVFLVGVISVYLGSTQLKIRHRVIVIIPILNVLAIGSFIRTASRECRFEIAKIKLNESRMADRICATKYPILLVHGVFFRDYKYFGYWGRIPAELKKNGAEIYYGKHQSAASVADCAAELDKRIREIVAETGCEKVNVIAHSKGGLDIRYAMHYCGTAKYVASLVTVGSPHRGSLFADHMLGKIPRSVQVRVADAYNRVMKRLGDEQPDFLAAVLDLTSEACVPRDREMIQPEGVYCISYGSKLNRAQGGRFPLNFTYGIAELYDKVNDGLVGERSFAYGEKYELITVDGKRGVGHGDMIDLNRENFDGFDVREFYVNLVSDLKQRGL